MTAPAALFVATRTFGLTKSRLPLMAALVARGIDVVACADADHTAAQLESAGVRVEPVPFERGGFQPRDVVAALRLRRLFRKYRPCLIHHFNAKPIAYGGLASRGLRALVVHTVTGLGHGFDLRGIDGRGTRAAYRVVAPRADAVIFQNPDDRELFIRHGWVSDARAHLIVGSGVDLDEYPIQPPPSDPPRILMVARLLRQKGVREFVEAARMVRSELGEAHFVLGGEWQEGHPDAVERAYIRKAQREGHIQFIGYVSNMDEELKRCSVFVLPSYYREGVPRVLLEASATARPVVTTDVPGCRDVVRHGRTGLIIPPRDGRGLAAAISHLIRSPGARVRMGREARGLVEEQFSLTAVTQRQLDLYAALGVSAAVDGHGGSDR